MKKAILFKNSVATFTDLPLTGNAEGDVRTVRSTGEQYSWSKVSGTGSIHDWRLLNDQLSTLNYNGKLTTELESQFNAASKSYYKRLIYTGDALTGIDIYVDDTMGIKLFGKVLTYTGDDLTDITITRVSDGASMSKTLTYASGSLDNIEVS